MMNKLWNTLKAIKYGIIFYFLVMEFYVYMNGEFLSLGVQACVLLCISAIFFGTHLIVGNDINNAINQKNHA